MANDYDMPMSPRPERTPVRPGYTTQPPSRPQPAGEAIGGGAVSVLSAPPPTSDNHPLTHEQICLALDELLDGQYRHDKALRTLRRRWRAVVCLLAAAVAVAVLYEAING